MSYIITPPTRRGMLFKQPICLTQKRIKNFISGSLNLQTENSKKKKKADQELAVLG